MARPRKHEKTDRIPVYLSTLKKVRAIAAIRDVDIADWFEERFKSQVEEEWRELLKDLNEEERSDPDRQGGGA